MNIKVIKVIILIYIYTVLCQFLYAQKDANNKCLENTEYKISYYPKGSNRSLDLKVDSVKIELDLCEYNTVEDNSDTITSDEVSTQITILYRNVITNKDTINIIMSMVDRLFSNNEKFIHNEIPDADIVFFDGKILEHFICLCTMDENVLDYDSTPLCTILKKIYNYCIELSMQ